MNPKILLVSFFLFTTIISAQQLLPKDYIITHNSDTIKGFIDDKQWKLNPEKIIFRKESSAPFSVYTASQIQGFYVSQSEEYYTGAVVGIDDTPYELELLITPKEIGRRRRELTRIDTVFLRTVTRGKATLFTLNEGGSRVHFYMQKLPQDTIVELIYKRFLRDTPMGTIGNKQIGTMEDYKRQLNEYLESVPTLKNKINLSKYEEQDLAGIFYAYNNPLSDEHPEITGKSELHIYILAGVSIANMYVLTREKAIQHAEDYTFRNSVKPSLTIGFDWRMPRLKQQWSWYNEFGYRSYSFYKENEYEGSPYTTIPTAKTTGKVTISASNFMWTSAVRYHYVNGKLKLIFNAGVNFAKVLTSHNLYTETITIKILPDYENVKTDPAITSWKNQNAGWLAGIGLAYGKIITECRLEHNRATSIHFLIGYCIK